MGMIGYDHAQNANVALTTFPDPESRLRRRFRWKPSNFLMSHHAGCSPRWKNSGLYLRALWAKCTTRALRRPFLEHDPRAGRLVP